MFKEVQDLSPDVTTAIGGINGKTGKKNPSSLEGYYLGKRVVEDSKKRTGKAYIYVFQTDKGSVGVWSKTDLDRKMNAAVVGAMTRITCTGTTPTSKGDMYKYKVELDTDNSIEVTGAETGDQENSFDSEQHSEGSTFQESEDDSGDTDNAGALELAAAERKAKVQALLNKGKSLK